jgi:hypothetical protein
LNDRLVLGKILIRNCKGLRLSAGLGKKEIKEKEREREREREREKERERER